MKHAVAVSADQKYTYTCHRREVARALFDSNEERILSVHYPRAGDRVNSRSHVLGDDSVLLKYLNPHMAVLVTASPPQLDSEPLVGLAQEGQLRPLCRDTGYADEGATTDSGVYMSLLLRMYVYHKTYVHIYLCYVDLPMCQVHVNVLDTVSGKVVYRITHAPGSGPVEVAIAENNIVYSYWNAQYKRQELSSLGLYEGIIDKYGLTPFATHASAAAAAVHTAPGAGIHSAFIAQIPLGITPRSLMHSTIHNVKHITMLYTLPLHSLAAHLHLAQGRASAGRD